jgi:hypothetical protein
MKQLPELRNNPQNGRKSSPAIEQINNSRTCKELKRLNNKRTNNPVNKWGDELDKQF